MTDHPKARTIRVRSSVSTLYRSTQHLSPDEVATLQERAREVAHAAAVDRAEDAAREAYTDAYAAAFDDAYRDELERST